MRMISRRFGPAVGRAILLKAGEATGKKWSAPAEGFLNES